MSCGARRPPDLSPILPSPLQNEGDLRAELRQPNNRVDHPLVWKTQGRDNIYWLYNHNSL